MSERREQDRSLQFWGRVAVACLGLLCVLALGFWGLIIVGTVAAAIWGITKAEREERERIARYITRMSSPAPQTPTAPTQTVKPTYDLNKLEWHGWELLTALWLRHTRGGTVALTSFGADGGVDVWWTTPAEGSNSLLEMSSKEVISI